MARRLVIKLRVSRCEELLHQINEKANERLCRFIEEMQNLRPPALSYTPKDDEFVDNKLWSSQMHYHDINASIIKELDLPPVPPGCLNILDTFS